MRTANTNTVVILAAINAGINNTLSNIFVNRNATCTTGPTNRCDDGNTTSWGECPNWDWSLSPRICMGNLIQDDGAELPEYRTHRATLNWCILHQDFQLEFTTWGFPESVELWTTRGGELYCEDSDGILGAFYFWSEDFKLTRISEEDGGPNKMAIRRNRMSHMGEAERRASRGKADNSWKRHRSTQWR
jgi:hypothetical protein